LRLAIDLAGRGAQVVLACRNLKAGEHAACEIIRLTKNIKVHAELLNLADMRSIRDFAKRFEETYGVLDILVNNAGPFKKRKLPVESCYPVAISRDNELCSKCD
jgi:NAD(P)-dependent dehydrogenase (short-subunit alcohol dehydrogenase family)